MAKGGVKVIDRGWNDIKKQLQEYSDGKVAAIGIQGQKAAGDHGGITNAELGAIHEYGSQDGKIPERSHLRSTMADEEKANEKKLKDIATKRIFDGKSADGDLFLLGEEMRAKVINKIKGGLQPPLAETTLAGRGEGPPLWDTGQYLNSITSEVVDLEDKRE